MQVDDAGRAFIAGNEGYTPVPKIDAGGKLVWGHGHDQQPGEIPPTFISEPDSDALLVVDCPRFEPAVNALIPPSCTQNQFNALLDFCYNEGPTNLATMLHHGWDQVPVQILAWCYEHIDGVPVKVPGLLARRQKELALFQQP